MCACSVASGRPEPVSQSRTVPSPATTGHQPTVGGQRDAPDTAGVAVESGHEPPGTDVPQTHRSVCITAGQQPAVSRQRDAPDHARWALHRPLEHAVGQAPQQYLPGRRSDCQQRPIPTQGDRAGEVECFSQGCLGEVGVHQTGALRVNFRQIGLTNGQLGEVDVS